MKSANNREGCVDMVKLVSCVRIGRTTKSADVEGAPTPRDKLGRGQTRVDERCNKNEEAEGDDRENDDTHVQRRPR